MTAHLFYDKMSGMGPNDISSYVTTADAAKELNISQRHMRRLITTGVVSGCVEVGKTYLIPREQIEAAKARPKRRGKQAILTPDK